MGPEIPQKVRRLAKRRIFTNCIIGIHFTFRLVIQIVQQLHHAEGGLSPEFFVVMEHCHLPVGNVKVIAGENTHGISSGDVARENGILGEKR